MTTSTLPRELSSERPNNSSTAARVPDLLVNTMRMRFFLMILRHRCDLLPIRVSAKHASARKFLLRRRVARRSERRARRAFMRPNARAASMRTSIFARRRALIRWRTPGLPIRSNARTAARRTAFERSFNRAATTAAARLRYFLFWPLIARASIAALRTRQARFFVAVFNNRKALEWEVCANTQQAKTWRYVCLVRRLTPFWP
jgi:hypothetical protein